MENRLAMIGEKGQGDILRTANFKLNRKGSNDKNFKRFLSDRNGTYAMVYSDAIISAKKYIKNGIVSCHNNVISCASAYNIPIIMYISELDRFYLFEAKDILNNVQTFQNIRNGEFMTNWLVNLGERYESSRYQYEAM